MVLTYARSRMACSISVLFALDMLGSPGGKRASACDSQSAMALPPCQVDCREFGISAAVLEVVACMTITVEVLTGGTTGKIKNRKAQATTGTKTACPNFNIAFPAGPTTPS